MTNGQNHSTSYQQIDPRQAGYFGRTSIGSRPNISNAEFKLLLECLDAGDSTMLGEVLDSYSFDTTQKSLLRTRNVQA